MTVLPQNSYVGLNPQCDGIRKWESMGSDQVNDEGGALMNEINAVIKENPEGFPTSCH